MNRRQYLFSTLGIGFGIKFINKYNTKSSIATNINFINDTIIISKDVISKENPKLKIDFKKFIIEENNYYSSKLMYTIEAKTEYEESSSDYKQLAKNVKTDENNNIKELTSNKYLIPLELPDELDIGDLVDIKIKFKFKTNNKNIGTFIKSKNISLEVRESIKLYESIISRWTFNDEVSGDGDIVKDVEGNLDGKTVDGVFTSSSGILNKSFEFDGDGARVEISDAKDIIPEDFTFSFWSKPEIQTGDGTANMFFGLAQKDNESDSRTYIDDSNSSGKFRFYSEGDSIGTTTEIIKYNEWHHYVITNNSSNNEIILYRDSKLIDTINGHINLTELTRDNWDFWIGYGFHSSGPREYKGKIDDVHMYDSVLTNEQISNLYDSYNI